MKQKGSALLFVCALLVSPASAVAQASQQEIDQAEHACDRSPSVPWSSREAYATCLGASERIVLVGYRPELAASFDAFQDGRVSLARMFDTGQIDVPHYEAAEQSLEANFVRVAADTPSRPTASPAESRSALGSIADALDAFNDAYWRARKADESRSSTTNCYSFTAGQVTCHTQPGY